MISPERLEEICARYAGVEALQYFDRETLEDKIRAFRLGVRHGFELKEDLHLSPEEEASYSLGFLVGNKEKKGDHD